MRKKILLLAAALPVIVQAQMIDEVGIITERNGSASWGGSGSIQKMVIAPVSDNIYVAGYFNGNTIDFDPRTGTNSGGSTTNSQSRGTNNAGANNEGFLVKYNAKGIYIRFLQLSLTTSPAPTTQTSYSNINSIVLDANENVYVVGEFCSTCSGNTYVDFDPGTAVYNLASSGGYDIFVAKYDSTFTFQWAFNIGSSTVGSYEKGKDIAIDASGNIYITGAFDGTADFDPSTNTTNLVSAGYGDIFVAKYDGTLSPSSTSFFKWANRAGGGASGNDFDMSFAIDVDASSNVYIGGNFTGTNVDFDPGTGTNNLSSSNSGANRDIFFAKYNSSGAHQWAYRIGPTTTSTRWSAVMDLDVDNNGDLIICGHFRGGSSTNLNVNFSPKSGTNNLATLCTGTSTTATDGFVAKYDNAGNYIWAFDIQQESSQLGTVASQYCYAVSADLNNNVYVAGRISVDDDDDDIDLNPIGTNLHNIESADPDADGFLLCVNSSLTTYNFGYSFGSASSSLSGVVNPRTIGFMDMYQSGYSGSAGSVFVGGDFTDFCEFKKGTSSSRRAAAEYRSPYPPTKQGGSGIDLFIMRVGSLAGGSSYSYEWGYAPSYGIAGTDVSGNGAMVLPVELLEFTAVPDDGDVKVSWVTASEINNDYFSVEKTTDNINFDFVAKIKGSGNSNERMHYEVIDRDPFSGVSYYRLKQTDFDGAFTYSQSVVVVNHTAEEAGVSMFPNPMQSGEKAFLNMQTNEQEQILVVVYDFAGKESYSKVFISETPGSQLIAIDPEGKLAAGIYHVVASSDHRVFRQKLVVR